MTMDSAKNQLYLVVLRVCLVHSNVSHVCDMCEPLCVAGSYSLTCRTRRCHSLCDYTFFIVSIKKLSGAATAAGVL